jgi:3-phenylpropionate/trans-cinnamate dioxygenase ferredoxin subunit
MAAPVTVAKRSEIACGQVRVFNVGGERIAVANVDDAFFAIEDRCSHDDGPLGEGALRGSEIECPRHGARFDVKSGRPLCLPAVVPVRTYSVLVEGDDVKLSLG